MNAPFTFTDSYVGPSGQVTLTTTSPIEIASWYFMEETEDHEKARESLAADIERLIERSIIEAQRTQVAP